MRYRGLTTVLIGVSALCLAGCASTKQTASKEVLSFKVQDTREQEARDSLREEQVMVAVRDTLKEVTTVTVQLNETGDTVKVSTVTDRIRASDRSQLRDKSEKLIVKTDTVYIERRDSVLVKSEELRVKSDRPSAFVSALRWVFWIIVGLSALIIIVKLKV